MLLRKRTRPTSDDYVDNCRTCTRVIKSDVERRKAFVLRKKTLDLDKKIIFAGTVTLDLSRNT